MKNLILSALVYYITWINRWVESFKKSLKTTWSYAGGLYSELARKDIKKLDKHQLHGLTMADLEIKKFRIIN